MKRYERFTSIPGKFHARPGTRVGKIHTGLPKTPDGKWGAEVDYFVLDFDAVDELGQPDPMARGAAEAVAKVYGEKPKALEAVFLGNDQASCAPYEYKKYGASRRPVCRGNGEFCIRKVKDPKSGEVEMVQLPCPAPEACDFARDEKGRTVCAMITNFTILLPRVSLWGTYQIDTKSYHAQSNFQDWAESVKAVVGRIRGVPVVITRPPHRSELPQGGYSTHFPLKFTSPDNQKFKALLGSFLSARNLIVQAESRVAVSNLEGPGFASEMPDDRAPERLVPREGADPPSRDNGVDDLPETHETGPCPGCGKATDVQAVDQKTGEVTGWAPCDACLGKEQPGAQKLARKRGQRKGQAATVPPAGQGAAPPGGPPNPQMGPAGEGSRGGGGAPPVDPNQGGAHGGPQGPLSSAGWTEL